MWWKSITNEVREMPMAYSLHRREARGRPHTLGLHRIPMVYSLHQREEGSGLRSLNQYSWPDEDSGSSAAIE